METKNIILKLRTQIGMSQDELADKIMVTRQAVFCWENGDTITNTETLKLLSKEFDVSINTLLGEPRKLICQCCGMPIDDDSILGRDKDGTLNEDYCKWCYADGNYTYNTPFFSLDRIKNAFTCGLLYLKDMSILYPATFTNSKITNLVINNETPPEWRKTNNMSDDQANNEQKKSLVFIESDVSNIYVPDAAVTTYQQDENW